MKESIAKKFTLGACLISSLVLVAGCQEPNDPHGDPLEGIQDHPQLELQSQPAPQSLEPLPAPQEDTPQN